MSKIYGLAPDREETLEILARAAAQRGVQVFAKVLWGDPAKKLTEAVHKVPLQWLVVGNRGLSTVKRYGLVWYARKLARTNSEKRILHA